MNSSKTVLITGASGFIGMHIVSIFVKHSWKIIAVVNKNLPVRLASLTNVTVIKADLTNVNLQGILPCKIDAVIHVAGLASDIGSDAFFKKINFDSVKNVANLSGKLIYISSTDVYGMKDFSGENEEELPLEKHPINPYPKYKIESEKWITSNLASENYVILRPAAVWGTGDKTLEKRFVDFLKKSPFIFFFGKWKGKNRWPLANVEKIATVAYVSTNCHIFDGQAINIIDAKKTSIEEFYNQMVKKHYPHKRFYKISLPFWVGYVLGCISTSLSNLFKMKSPLFDPSKYAIYHVSSNLDFDCKKQKAALQAYAKMQK